MDERARICERLLADSRALGVRLADEHGRALALAGPAPDDEAPHVHTMQLASGPALTVWFDDRSSLGLVRLRTFRMHAIRDLLRAARAGRAQPPGEPRRVGAAGPRVHAQRRPAAPETDGRA
jgi:hypothetical protein